MYPSVESSGWSRSLLRVLWGVLAFLLLCLIGVAAVLLVRMDFFSGRAPTDNEVKSVWAFVGVALGAVVTLIGALLTEQHNRRTVALTREAAERETLAKEAQEALDKHAQKRLSLDTVGRLLELITNENGEYAKPARVGGAIATMIELEGGTVALRILDDLWSAGAVNTATAVWPLERVLENPESTDNEQLFAAYLLATNASKLLPAADDPHQEWFQSVSVLDHHWPLNLASGARNTLQLLMVRLLLARDLSYWKHTKQTYPVIVLQRSLVDEEYRAISAYILPRLMELGVLDELSVALDNTDQLRSWADSYDPKPWFADLLSQFESWAAGDDVHNLPSSGLGSIEAASPPSASADP
jgi:hypothetical protein